MGSVFAVLRHAGGDAATVLATYAVQERAVAACVALRQTSPDVTYEVVCLASEPEP